MGSVRLSADKESIGVDKRVYRSCLMFFAFLPSELGCLSVIIGEAENGFAKMTKAFRRVEKWFCEIDKGISAGGKMRLRKWQRHFGGWKNGFANTLSLYQGGASLQIIFTRRKWDFCK